MNPLARLQAQALFEGLREARTPQDIAEATGAPVSSSGAFNALDFGKNREEAWFDLPEWERTKLMAKAIEGRDVPLVKVGKD